MEEIGLFPLQLVLLPTEVVPLHVFEERYKELVGECIESDGVFGLVYADGDSLQDVGTRARVTRVVTRFQDGRMNVLVEGGDRFRVEELTEGRSFRTALVSPFGDEDDPAGLESVERALGLFEQLRTVTGTEIEAPGAETERLSFALAARVELPVGDKLELLGETSERRRLDRVADLLEHVLAGMERARLASERSSTNGRVELG